MAKRSYDDRCGIARALDIVGERWALLVVRELVLGPKRFTDLRSGLRLIGPDVLTQRLKDLEAAGLVEKRRLDPPAASTVYELTNRGAALEPLLLELGRWGSGLPMTESQGPLTPDSFVLALKTMLPAGAGDETAGPIALELREEPFVVRSNDAGGLDFRRGRTDDAVATISADPDELAGILWQGGGSAAALKSDRVAVDGNRRAARAFLSLFSL